MSPNELCLGVGRNRTNSVDEFGNINENNRDGYLGEFILRLKHSQNLCHVFFQALKNTNIYCMRINSSNRHLLSDNCGFYMATVAGLYIIRNYTRFARKTTKHDDSHNIIKYS
ncbi:hypothetical protein RF11_05757 [Thelohanellus kitauei]|uniref:Uncharacterized protein n=1 Tax=Thelohanellus kitauei TaxID=669202 RepID=A0A0C2NE77_THEKT|nr:hypothetical protein RF11_05757 [Thelohanellus kitauei]